MNDKTKYKIISKFGIGSLSPILFILGIIIFWLSSIIVDAKKFLDLPQWVGLSMILIAWNIGNKYHTDFGAKWTKKISIYVGLFMMIMLFTSIFIFHLFLKG